MKTADQTSEAAKHSPIKAVWVIGAAVAIYLGSQIIAVLILSIYASLRGLSETEIERWLTGSVVGQFWFVLLVEICALGLLLWYMRRRQLGLKSIGLIKPTWRDLGYALSGFVIYLPLLVVVITLLQAFLPQIDFEQPQQIGFESAAGGELILVFISLVALPAVVEEILARGFLYSGLKKYTTKLRAIFITSLLFAMAHLQFGSGAPLVWAAAIDTFILSLILIWLKERTGSLWAPIGLHAIKNGIAFLNLFVFSNLFLR